MLYRLAYSGLYFITIACAEVIRRSAESLGVGSFRGHLIVVLSQRRLHLAAVRRSICRIFVQQIPARIALSESVLVCSHGALSDILCHCLLEKGFVQLDSSGERIGAK